MNDLSQTQLFDTLTKFHEYAKSNSSCLLRRIGPVQMLVSPAGILVFDFRGSPMTFRPVSVQLAAVLIENW
jgi:hypothetical protein